MDQNMLHRHLQPPRDPLQRNSGSVFAQGWCLSPLLPPQAAAAGRVTGAEGGSRCLWSLESSGRFPWAGTASLLSASLSKLRSRAGWFPVTSGCSGQGDMWGLHHVPSTNEGAWGTAVPETETDPVLLDPMCKRERENKHVKKQKKYDGGVQLSRINENKAGEGRVYRALRQSLSKKVRFKQQRHTALTRAEWPFSRAQPELTEQVSLQSSDYITKGPSHSRHPSTAFAPTAKSLGSKKVVSFCYDTGPTGFT